MELRHLRYFVAVAEELHFGRAAACVRTAQSSFSAQIRDREEELGVELLHRTKRHVHLTDAGRAFLEQVRATLKQAAHAVRVAQRAARGETGTFAIGFVPSADCISFPEILRVFKHRYRDVQIDLRNLTATEQIEALRSGDIDIGFLRPLRTDGLIASERIIREPVVVVLPRKHRLLAKPELRLAEIASEELILCSRYHAPLQHDVIISQFRAADLVPNVLLETDHIQTVLGLVAAGLGISLLPASVENLRAPGLSYRPLKEPAPRMEMAVAYRKGDPSQVLGNFLTLVRELSRHGFKLPKTPSRRTQKTPSTTHKA
jgi:DNA-binding transcriptional LysR family regulator